MSPTLRWLVRIFGIVMMLVFAYMLCSMQQELGRRLEEQRHEAPREAPPGQRPPSPR